jgi:RimJ/RimL family protein N-acetyltransferase
MLRPVSEADYEYLYGLFTREEHTFLWRFRGAAPGPEVFVQMLWQNVLCQFVVIRRKDSSRVGLITAFNSDFRNGFTYLALVIDPGATKTLAAHDSTMLLINYLFRGWNFRKVYAETTERHIDRLFPGAINRYVRVEARLPRHEFFDGRYWEGCILALYRDEWMRILAERLPRIL